MGLANGAGDHFTLHGTEATLDADNLAITSEHANKDKQIKTRKIKPEPDESHMGNWVECIRSRKRPNADIQLGHQHSVATIMVATAFSTGRHRCSTRQDEK